MPDLVEVSLTLLVSAEDLAKHLGGDYIPGKTRGITVESCASSLVTNHDPRDGFVHWEIIS